MKNTRAINVVVACLAIAAVTYVLVSPDIDIDGVLQLGHHGHTHASPLTVTFQTSTVTYDVATGLRAASMMLLSVFATGPSVVDLTCTRLR